MKTILICVVCILSACGTVPGYYEADPIFREPTGLLQDKTDIVDMTKLNSRVMAVDSKEKRNELIIDLVTISERMCSRHQSSIIANANTWNVATGSITNFLSALGTVVGGEATKAGLAAGASLSSSTRSLVNNEVYAESVGTTIVRAINVAREKYFAEIKKGMSEPLKHYTLKSGMRDVQEYHRRCSFYYGLLEVSTALEQRKKTKAEIDSSTKYIKAKITELKSLGISTGELETQLKTLILQKESAPE